MVKPSREYLGQRALGAAGALIIAGAVFAASIIVHSRTPSEAFDAAIPLTIGLIVGTGVFLRWRGFWHIACIYTGIAIVLHVILAIPRANPFGGLIAVVAPRLVMDVLILVLLLLPSTRECYFRRTI